MITGVHAIIFSREAEELRSFLSSKLGFESVDAGGGWLIFALPPAELAAHPTNEPADSHRIYLMCDDIHATVEELSAKGVEFNGPVADEGFGLMASMCIPGGGVLDLYEPRHPVPR